MKKYKMGLIPAYPPYQLEDEYIVEYDIKISKSSIQNIVFKSKIKSECMKKLKELNNKAEN